MSTSLDGSCQVQSAAVAAWKERHWTDAQVRWTAANHNLEDDDQEPSDDEEASIFQPEPTKIFSYQFANPLFSNGASNHNHNHRTTDGATSPQSTTTTTADNEKIPEMINIDLRGYPETDDTIYMSTGLTLWRSSQLLCEYMLQASNGERGTGGLHRLLGKHPKDTLGDLAANSASENTAVMTKTPKTSRILELGAGLGLNGILAYLLLKYHHHQQQHANAGKDDESMEAHVEEADSVGYDLRQNTVIMTDGDTNALAVLRDNVKHLTEDDVNTKTNQRVTMPRLRVQQLLWGTRHAEQFLQTELELDGFSPRSKNTASGATLQGRKPQNALFDIILASDAIYVMENVRPLFESVQVLLAKPHGEFWFSYCCRRQVSVQIEDVLKAAEEMGFVHEQVLAKKDDDGDDKGVDNRLLAFVFRWKSSRD